MTPTLILRPAEHAHAAFASRLAAANIGLRNDDCLRIARMMDGGSTPREGDYPTGDELAEPSPEYEPETVPGYEPEYSELARGEDFDAQH